MPDTVPDKSMRTQKARQGRERRPRSVMLAIAGDSAAGKTTLTQGLVDAMRAEASTSVCVDDYHRYDRMERKELPFTPLHPDCNYVDIMEQHLQLLASGEAILKPVYDHATGELVRPERIEPTEAVIIEGLLPLYTEVMRACFDVSVYLDPPEEIRREWKIKRDTSKRGYEAEQVLAELERREPESEAFIRPQRSHADIVVRFGPIEGRDDPPDTPLSATVLLRPTIRHPKLHEMMADIGEGAMHLKLMRDEDGKPVDALHIHGYAPPEDSRTVAEAIWDSLGRSDPLPESLGDLGNGERSEPLALTQLILLFHLLRLRA
ncbi:MAG: phosphoribulokinase [Egibacteraceae bacterium]